MYRGGEGMWSFIFHRITGVAVFAFLAAHVVDTALLGWGPDVYNRVLGFYETPFFRVGELVLIAAVLYHALNGIRVMLFDFWVFGTRYQRSMAWIVVVVFAVLIFPTAYVMIRPLF